MSNFSARPRGKPQALADLIDACLGSALSAQGFARSSLIMGWDDIVGEDLAGRCAPLKVDWPRSAGLPGDAPQPGTLVVRVEGAFALDVQHLAPVIVEKVNAHLGWRCIGKLVLKQGPLPRKARKEPPPPPLDASEKAALAGRLDKVADEKLRAALDRLGENVIRAEQAGRRARS